MSLSIAGVLWVVGLALALFAAVLIGWERVTALRDVLISDRSDTVIVVNALLAVLGIGAPVWFAWLATKQIGNTFKLAEDYAFKASVAQAYEGYRTEAANFDTGMSARLFSAALDRFEEPPIRLVDQKNHSSPIQEVLENSNLMEALEKIPNLPEKLSEFVRGAVAPINKGDESG